MFVIRWPTSFIGPPVKDLEFPGKLPTVLVCVPAAPQSPLALPSPFCLPERQWEGQFLITHACCLSWCYQKAGLQPPKQYR